MTTKKFIITIVVLLTVSNVHAQRARALVWLLPQGIRVSLGQMRGVPETIFDRPDSVALTPNQQQERIERIQDIIRTGGTRRGNPDSVFPPPDGLPDDRLPINDDGRPSYLEDLPVREDRDGRLDDDGYGYTERSDL